LPRRKKEISGGKHGSAREKENGESDYAIGGGTTTIQKHAMRRSLLTLEKTGAAYTGRRNRGFLLPGGREQE